MVNRGAPIKQLEAMLRFWDIDKGEIERRGKILRQYGIKAPKTKKQCKKMIGDLIKCRI